MSEVGEANQPEVQLTNLDKYRDLISHIENKSIQEIRGERNGIPLVRTIGPAYKAIAEQYPQTERRFFPVAGRLLSLYSDADRGAKFAIKQRVFGPEQYSLAFAREVEETVFPSKLNSKEQAAFEKASQDEAQRIKKMSAKQKDSGGMSWSIVTPPHGMLAELLEQVGKFEATQKK